MMTLRTPTLTLAVGLLTVLAFSQAPPSKNTGTPAPGQAPAPQQPATKTTPAPKGFPFTSETLRYEINWPSSLSLGEATMTATKTEAGWNFEATVDARVLNYVLKDKYKSINGTDLCSQELERDIVHGARKNLERTKFDQKANMARRETVTAAPGVTNMRIPTCARDALTYAYYARVQLGQGVVPQQQDVFFGSAYSVSMQYTGAMTIPVNQVATTTDHVIVHVKGPKSDFNFEIFYARDAARTPLSVKIPLPVGTLSMDLVR